MTLNDALALFHTAVATMEQKALALDIGVSEGSITGWKRGVSPRGESRAKLMSWAERQPTPLPPVAVPSDYWRGVFFAAEVMSQTVADLLKQSREAHEAGRHIVTQFATTLAPTDPTDTGSLHRGTGPAAPRTARRRGSKTRE